MLTLLRDGLVRLGYCTSPTFLIIGAQKAGTTSLSAMLSQHSGIVRANRKECHFFNRKEKDFDVSFNYWKYHREFPLPSQVKKNAHVFEATPAYLYHPKAAVRIHAYNPKLKLILLVREPASRALSGWKMYHYAMQDNPKYAQKVDRRSFWQAIREEMERIDTTTIENDRYSYINRGIYHKQLKKYLDQFPQEQILILEQEELLKNHDASIKMALDFLESPYEKIEPTRLLQSGPPDETHYAEEMKFLREFYRPHNERLFEMIGKRFDWKTTLPLNCVH